MSFPNFDTQIKSPQFLLDSQTGKHDGLLTLPLLKNSTLELLKTSSYNKSTSFMVIKQKQEPQSLKLQKQS